MIMEVYVTHMGSTKQREMLPEPFPEIPDDVEAADWPGDREAEVVETFDDGGFVVSFDYAGGKYEPLTAAWYYVPPGAGEGPDAETWEDWWEVDRYGRRGTKERTAILLGRLSENTGFWWDAQGPGNCIPICVATDGQKAIAAYLFAWSNYSAEGIAEKMGKSESTIRQYLSDYKAGRTG
jgi:hypothetical protein